MVDDTRKSDGTEQSAPVRNKTVHTALINGTNFRGKAVQYVAIDGLAMFEGDIVLGTLEQVQAETDSLRAELAGGMASAVLISGSSARWPNCTMPYDIDPSLPDQARVTDAIGELPGLGHVPAQRRLLVVGGAAGRPAVHQPGPRLHPGQHHPRDRALGRPVARAVARGS